MYSHSVQPPSFQPSSANSPSPGDLRSLCPTTFFSVFLRQQSLPRRSTLTLSNHLLFSLPLPTVPPLEMYSHSVQPPSFQSSSANSPSPGDVLSLCPTTFFSVFLRQQSLPWRSTLTLSNYLLFGLPPPTVPPLEMYSHSVQPPSFHSSSANSPSPEIYSHSVQPPYFQSSSANSPSPGDLLSLCPTTFFSAFLRQQSLPWRSTITLSNHLLFSLPPPTVPPLEIYSHSVQPSSFQSSSANSPSPGDVLSLCPTTFFSVFLRHQSLPWRCTLTLSNHLLFSLPPPTVPPPEIYSHSVQPPSFQSSSANSPSPGDLLSLCPTTFFSVFLRQQSLPWRSTLTLSNHLLFSLPPPTVPPLEIYSHSVQPPSFQSSSANNPSPGDLLSLCPTTFFSVFFRQQSLPWRSTLTLSNHLLFSLPPPTVPPLEMYSHSVQPPSFQSSSANSPSPGDVLSLCPTTFFSVFLRHLKVSDYDRTSH